MPSKIPPHYLFILMLALCAGVIALFWTLVINPRKDIISGLSDDLSARQTKAETYRSAAAALPQLRTAVAKMEVERAEFVRALPTTAQFGQAISQIRTNVTAARADLKTLSFGNGQNTAMPAGVRAMDLNMDVGGQFSQIFQVLRSLETQNRFSTIKGVDLTLPQANSSDPKLESKLNFTIYTYDPALAAAGTPAGASDAAAPAAPAPAPAAASASGDIR